MSYVNELRSRCHVLYPTILVIIFEKDKNLETSNKFWTLLKFSQGSAIQQNCDSQHRSYFVFVFVSLFPWYCCHGRYYQRLWIWDDGSHFFYHLLCIGIWLKLCHQCHLRILWVSPSLGFTGLKYVFSHTCQYFHYL